MDLEKTIVIGSILLVVVIILLLSVFLYRRNARPVLIEGFSNQELGSDDRGKKRRWAKAKKKIKNWMDKIQFWKNIKIPNPLGWTRKHKFWTIFIIFYFVFLAVSLLHEYGIIR